jgi:hypothetical protein
MSSAVIRLPDCEAAASAAQAAVDVALREEAEWAGSALDDDDLAAVMAAGSGAASEAAELRELVAARLGAAQAAFQADVAAQGAAWAERCRECGVAPEIGATDAAGGWPRDEHLAYLQALRVGGSSETSSAAAANSSAAAAAAAAASLNGDDEGDEGDEDERGDSAGRAGGEDDDAALLSGVLPRPRPLAAGVADVVAAVVAQVSAGGVRPSRAASKELMADVPLRPSTSERQNAARPSPTELTTPIPVTRTRGVIDARYTRWPTAPARSPRGANGAAHRHARYAAPTARKRLLSRGCAP